MTAWMLAAAAFAEDPVFEGTDAAGQAFAEPTTRLSAELGATFATGNTDFYTLAAGLDGGREWKRNKLGLTAGALFGRGFVDADGSGSISDAERDAGRVETARRAGAEARYDRFFGDNDSLYALAAGLVDPFAGYDLRSHEQIGYSRRLVKTEKTEMLGEVGFDVAQENYVDGVDPNRADIFAGRVMLSVHQVLNANAAFDLKAELYENVVDPKDLRVLTTAGLNTKISDKLSFKLGHGLVFDNVPVEGFRNLDQVTTATLVASIF